MNNILITSAGQRVSLVRAFQKEIKKINATAKVYTVDSNPFLSPACQISDGYRQVNLLSDCNYIDELLNICKELQVGLIIPTIDLELELLANNRLMFKENNIEIVISSSNFVQICRDKRRMNLFFKEKGIQIPTLISKENPSFPLFIKPYDGSLSKDIFVINTADELTEYHLSNEKLMFMEYIDPVYYDEYTIDAYYDKNNQLKCAVPRKRIAVRSGEISKGLTSKNHLVNYVHQKLSKIEGAIGCLTIQVFCNKVSERVIGIEINARFGGGYPLSYLSGANYPQWLIKEYLLNEEIHFFKEWENNLLMLRYDDEVLVRNYEE